MYYSVTPLGDYIYIYTDIHNIYIYKYNNTYTHTYKY